MAKTRKIVLGSKTIFILITYDADSPLNLRYDKNHRFYCFSLEFEIVNNLHGQQKRLD